MTHQIDVRFDGDTVWLSRKIMSELFNCSIDNVEYHLKNIFQEQELDENSVSEESSVTANDGKNYKTKFYNLEAIIAVWYRVNSKQATQFRIRATQKLKEYIIKWFVIDDERLKNPDVPFDYFEELLARIQDIRTSEKRFYRKITDIYITSIDYDPTDPLSITFFQTVQNKVHYVITGKTAAEIIASRADATKEHMWLSNWRWNDVRKTDISTAKNYLQQEELQALNNLVEQYLVFAEGQAQRRIPMKMIDWIEKLNWFLELNDREILENAWTISHEEALTYSENQYTLYKQSKSQNISLDEFDKEIEKHIAPLQELEKNEVTPKTKKAISKAKKTPKDWFKNI